MNDKDECIVFLKIYLNVNIHLNEFIVYAWNLDVNEFSHLVNFPHIDQIIYKYYTVIFWISIHQNKMIEYVNSIYIKKNYT